MTLKTYNLSSSFVSNLEKALSDKGFSPSSLGFHMGISSSYIYEILSNKKNPSLKTVQKISDALEIDPMELLKNDVKR